MKKNSIVLFLLLIASSLAGQKTTQIMPWFQQSGMYFASDHVTVMGYGFGAGLAVYRGEHFILQTGMNYYALNGNAFSNTIMAGYKKQGVWAPALSGYLSVMYGSRTQMLLEDGSQPASPGISFGLRLAPFRFEHKMGFVSVFENALGTGRYKAFQYELALLTLGIKSDFKVFLL
ncbi:MAG: hypothetical protein HC906_15435 [Bacteroidales bacterium]|nr:hypothetical protein [Bacteroidales bacterium]